jgi:hypothetical protein
MPVIVVMNAVTGSRKSKSRRPLSLMTTIPEEPVPLSRSLTTAPDETPPGTPRDMPPPAPKEKKKRKPRKIKPTRVEGEEETKKPPNVWNTHVNTFRTAHPDLSFKEVLQQAKGTYKRKVPEQKSMSQ